jgi:hypothetical protein
MRMRVMFKWETLPGRGTPSGCPSPADPRGNIPRQLFDFNPS